MKTSPWRALEIVTGLFVILIITIILTILVHCIVYVILSSAPQENTRRVNETVKAVCDQAIQIDNPSAYSFCRAAQTASTTEYICENDTSTTCWVEDKR